ncbi:WD40 repeat-like protein [Dichomitus squalens LYAD-421 SS1]|uniref:Ribosome biogenesis protein YTM1 n=1 Tax=Dichomitus squalens (strain LYAD-421) TaxID=732165 RepID=R7SQ19_DICSQ|nr:WD40 repeat-like protein [Dichomitus squalens LYAD-421 SS1]EJF58274.1 WD40 repeat-like protein [Dichomitus squalens LYAD-421 SS1]
MTSTSEPNHPVVFTTQTPYPLPSQKFMIPTSWKRYQLSQLVNKALSLPRPIPFEFLVRGEILRGTLAEWCAESGVGEEETLEIEYFESVMPPQRMSSLPHEDWVSSISCQTLGHFLTASYDGAIRVFDYPQKLLQTVSVHPVPITSIAVVPSDSPDSHLIASASHDLTARLTRVDLSQTAGPSKAQTVASLHLHTAPVSSVAANASGSHILTSSWDGLIGLFDSSVPTTDEVPADNTANGDRKKRRKVGEDGDPARPKRKAPTAVLKSHTARVSRVVFGRDAKGTSAFSCGFDSTVRTWDVENGVCTGTITASTKPFLDLALSRDGSTALAASTDRTVSQYDLRAAMTSATTPSIASLAHPATPSCIAVSPAEGSEQQLVTGAYDGVVRLWDLRSTKSAVAAFRAWEDRKEGGRKVLSVDWARGLVGVGGEGGVEVWKVGEGERLSISS